MAQVNVLTAFPRRASLPPTLGALGNEAATRVRPHIPYLSIMNLRLVLASSSTYRKALLERFALDFYTFSPDVDESPLPDETPAELAKRLARDKSTAAAKHFPSALIIGSDQVASRDNAIIGKPGDTHACVEQLVRASGQRMDFLTGLCVLNTESGAAQLDVIRFSVVFRDLTRQQVKTYVAREQPFDCAGGFRSEGLGIGLFERLEGDDPTALIGLPLIRLSEMLRSEGLDVLLQS